MTDTSIFQVSTVQLANMDLPAPHILRKARGGHKFRIAVVVVATGVYIKQVALFAKSAQTYFCTDHHVQVLVLGDSRLELESSLHAYVRWLNITSPPWPFPTLKKPHFALSHWETIKEFEYAFIMDVDMVFVRPVGLEVLDETVASLHPGFFGKPRETFPYESSDESASFVRSDQGTHYFAGGLYGGSTSSLLTIVKALKDLTDADLTRGRTPRFNDESVINRFFASGLVQPHKILSPRYVGPDFVRQPPYINCGAQMPLSEVRIIHLEKCNQVEQATGRCHVVENRQVT